MACSSMITEVTVSKKVVQWWHNKTYFTNKNSTNPIILQTWYFTPIFLNCVGKTILKITRRHVVVETDKKYIWLQLLFLHLCWLIHYQINTFLEPQIFSQPSQTDRIFLITNKRCFTICEISFKFLMNMWFGYFIEHLMWFSYQYIWFIYFHSLCTIHRKGIYIYIRVWRN